MSLSNNYYDNPITNEDFIQIAVDYYGSAVRDNEISNLIDIGKSIHQGLIKED